MIKKLLLVSFIILFHTTSKAQNVSVLGSGTSLGWGTDTYLSTTDNIFYKITNIPLSANEVKFRQDGMWNTNWGGTTFPTGTGDLNGQNIGINPAGNYDIYFNRLSAGYSFLPTNTFPQIGIWGPAVNSQLGYGAPDVQFHTSDGINYLLSAFYYSGGSAYFRQDKCSGLTFGSTSFPDGTAQPSGPTIQVAGGLFSCRYNRTSGVYSFSLPSIGILGTALNGYSAPDTNLNTLDGYTYTLNNLVLNTGTVKFRLDDEWLSNWGGTSFPLGTGTPSGLDITVTPGTYNLSFNRQTADYSFTNTLTNETFSNETFKVFPNPTNSVWNINATNAIDSIQLFDVLGKQILNNIPNSDTTSIDATTLKTGIYFVKLSMKNTTETIRLIKI
ncbi:MAG: T9SS type A sorting domain-containing protein [Flavobacterium sp.]|nr:T9SS type A sorting domain-containing protein [Flavobacterium sp.]